MESGLKYAMIAAACRGNGIGYKGALPWRLKKEMAFFTRVTSSTIDPEKRNAVIMGRNTWQSIPAKYRPLPRRVNVVLSNQLEETPQGAHHLFRSLSQALEALAAVEGLEKVFIVGGARLYQEAMERTDCARIYLTRIEAHFECDTFFPEVDASMFRDTEDPDVPREVQEEEGLQYKYFVFDRVAQA